MSVGFRIWRERRFSWGFVGGMGGMIWGGVRVGCSPRLLTIPFTLTLAVSHQGRGEYFLCPSSLDSRVRGNDEGTCGNDTSSLPLPRHPPLSLRFPRPLRIAKGARRLLATEDWVVLGSPGRAGIPAYEGGFETRPYVVSPFAVRRGRGLVSFRACWMLWRTPSMLLMTSLFQKRRAR